MYKANFDHLYTEEFKRVYAGMEVRAPFVKEHARRIQALFKKRQAAHNPNEPITWQDMIDALQGTVDFVTENKRMFPNWREHLATWDLLIDIAKYHLEHKTILRKEESVEEQVDLPGYYEDVLHSKPVR